MTPGVEEKCCEQEQYFYFDIGAEPKIIILEAWSAAGSKANPNVAMEVIDMADVNYCDFDLSKAKLRKIVNDEKNKWAA